MSDARQLLAMDDKTLLSQCQVDLYKSSGPGGQHRNKVSSAVRLRHQPTGVSAHGDESRSQRDNKVLALRRLRMNIACRVRQGVDISRPEIPAIVRECLVRVRKGPQAGSLRLTVGLKDRRFWYVACYLLDLLEASQGRLAPAAESLGVTTANMAATLTCDRHLLAATQDIRKRFGRKPLH